LYRDFLKNTAQMLNLQHLTQNPMANSEAVQTDNLPVELPAETLSYKLKCFFLGPPLVNEALRTERLGRPTALAVLSSDVMSSCAYATEQILIVLIVAIGLGAFRLVLPVTFAICVVLLFVTLSYLQVIKFFPKAGGAYVVTRDTFGPKLAQLASAALLIDYTLTVAVSVASGVDALTSAIQSLTPYTVELSVLFVLIIAYGNLRGVREAGKSFAIPTFLFIFNIFVLVVTGVVRWVLGNLPVMSPHQPGAYPIGHATNGLLMGATLFVVAQAFANGGTALTGTEAISNGVSVFRLKARPFFKREVVEGVEGQSYNARTTLIAMSVILGCMFVGISLLASHVHPVPRISGTPTVVAQIADTVYGKSLIGRILYYFLQFSTTAILTLAANTSFTGFPMLASFAAEDSFLPRQLTKRGHRLVFSNGILVLTTASLILLIVTRANVTSLISLYAIGVFTGFTLAGVGMVKYHLIHKERHWQRKILVNGSAGILSAFVDLVFIVTKFLEGAWVVVVLVPIMIWSFIRLHNRYVLESKVLAENAPNLCVAPILPRHMAIVLVERLDLATARALQYARSLMPDELRAVHFVVDPDEAKILEKSWGELGLSRFPLDLIDCPDRRLGRASVQVAYDSVRDGKSELTVLIPRRVHDSFTRRLLHDRTSERIAALVSEVKNCAATIVPYKVPKEVFARAKKKNLSSGEPQRQLEAELTKVLSNVSVSGATPIKEIALRQRVKVAGRINSVRVQPRGGTSSLECILADSTGKVTLVFQGRRSIPGIMPGTKLVAEGVVGLRGSQFVILNPIYEILEVPESTELLS
jgi:amino acid transporter